MRGVWSVETVQGRNQPETGGREGQAVFQTAVGATWEFVRNTAIHAYIGSRLQGDGGDTVITFA